MLYQVFLFLFCLQYYQFLLNQHHRCYARRHFRGAGVIAPAFSPARIGSDDDLCGGGVFHPRSGTDHRQTGPTGAVRLTAPESRQTLAGAAGFIRAEGEGSPALKGEELTYNMDKL